MLMTPGNRPDRLRKAAVTRADCLVFDLEDSVPPAAKVVARDCVAQVLRELGRGAAERCVRINSLASGFGAEDLASLPLALVDSIMVPKVESASGLLEVQRQLQALGCDHGRARVWNWWRRSKRRAASCRRWRSPRRATRTTALFFGSGDYTAATGGAMTDTALLFPRSVVAAAAGAVGIQAIDAAYFQDVRDAEATRRDAQASPASWASPARWCSIPRRSPPPTKSSPRRTAEIERAQRIVRPIAPRWRRATARRRPTACSSRSTWSRRPNGCCAAPCWRASGMAAHRPTPDSNHVSSRQSPMTMQSRPLRLQRSELAVPATSPRFFAKAAAGPADTVFLDLEDAVAPAQKDQARAQAIEALQQVDWGSKTVAVRVNGLDTPWALQDIVDVARQAPRLDLILLPKAGSGFDVRFVDQLLTLVERETGRTRRTGIEVLIETALGVANVEEIAQASDRLEAMIFGVGATTVDMRTHDRVFGRPSERYAVLTDADGAGARQRGHWNDQWHFAMARIATACRAWGLRPIDGPLPTSATRTATVPRRCAPGRWASKASGRSIRRRSHWPTRCSRPAPRSWNGRPARPNCWSAPRRAARVPSAPKAC